MKCPKCGSEMGCPRYMCDITKMVFECSKCNYSKIMESDIGYKDRLDKVLEKMKKQNDSYYSYTIMSEIYIYYDIEDKTFDIYIMVVQKELSP